MIDRTRVMSAALIAAALTMSGTPAWADAVGRDADGGWWSDVRAGAADLLDYGVTAVRSLAGWVIGGPPPATEARSDDIRALLNLSDKEFREFDALIHAAGYVLQGYSFGLDGAPGLELSFDLERAISEPERLDLRHQMEQQGGAASAVRHDVILGLLDATRYVDASPAGGYRLTGVTIRLGSPSEVRVRFRRGKS